MKISKISKQVITQLGPGAVVRVKTPVTVYGNPEYAMCYKRQIPLTIKDYNDGWWRVSEYNLIFKDHELELI